MSTARALSAAVSLVLTGAVASAALAAPPASAAQARPVVTPASARAAVVTVAKALSTAGGTYDVALQDTVEAGASKAADDADFRLSKLVGYAPYKPFTWAGTTVLVPRQTHYPATFLALTHYRTAGAAASKQVIALAFQRNAASAPWRVVADLGFGSGPVPRFTLGKDGYLPALATSSLLASPEAMYAALVKAQNVAATGAKPSAVWAYTTLWSKYLSQTKGEAKDSHETFTTSHRAPLCFAARAGAFCMTSTNEVRLQTSTAAEVAAQDYWMISSPDDQYDAGGVPQGSYATIRTVAQRQLGVLIPTKATTARLTVTAEFWSPLSGTGTPPPGPTA